MTISIKKVSKKEMYHLVFFTLLIWIGIFFISYSAYASTDLTIGGVASLITRSFRQLAKLITAASYLSGLGFAIGAIMKFKQHKDNPTQIPVGTPIALLFIASALLFLPSVLGVSGMTLFGSEGGTVAGPSGIIFS